MKVGVIRCRGIICVERAQGETTRNRGGYLKVCVESNEKFLESIRVILMRISSNGGY